MKYQTMFAFPLFLLGHYLQLRTDRRPFPIINCSRQSLCLEVSGALTSPGSIPEPSGIIWRIERPRRGQGVST